MSQGEFLVWVAEVENQIVGTSGLVLFTRPPYDEKKNFLSHAEAQRRRELQRNKLFSSLVII
ncbi:hypothetical protein A6S26_09990 [Nostoc sp. ATCC 43529]|nr:hypothetical protein A6S26_09990 [Nostoc sp. ATCC 43529]